MVQLRPLFACSAVALSAIGASGCGGASKNSALAPRGSSGVSASGGVAARTVSSPGSTTGSPVLDTDADNDSPGNNRYDTDNDAVLTFGQLADTADTQAIAALVRRYYRAAAARDGVLACSLLYWLTAESVVEEHHQGKGPPSLRGNTCAQVASKVFAQRHRELAEDVAALEVAVVRVKGSRGLALLRFGATRERRVLVHREGGVWKMDVLLDAGAP